MRHSTTLILAAIVAVAAVAIYVYRDELTGEPKPPEKPTGSLRLIEDVTTDDLASAQLEAAGDDGQMAVKMAFRKVEGKWRLTAPVDALADDYEVGRLLRPAVEGQYKKTAEPGKNGQPGLATFGLEPPAFRLALTTNAKNEKPERTLTVEIGKKAALGGLYVRLAGTDKVVVFEDDDLLERARERLSKYRSRNLVDLPRDDVVRVQVEGEKGTVRLDRAADDRDRWVVSAPMASRADKEVVSGLLRTALNAMVADFIDDNVSDLSPYGLDKPRLTVTLYKAGQPPEKPKEEKPADDPKGEAKKDEAKEEPAPEPVPAVTLHFGSWADLKKESVYLRLGDSKSVVGVEDDAYTGLNKGLPDLRDKHVLAIDKGRITQVSLQVPAKLAEDGADVAYDLEKKADGEWQVKVKGRPDAKADTETVEKLLKELEDLKVMYFAEGENADAAKGFKPQGSIRVQAENASAASGFEIGGPDQDVPALVKNIREDWIGRINPNDLKQVRQDWLGLLDKVVFSCDPAKAIRLAIQAPDRTLVFDKKDDKWVLTAPLQDNEGGSFATDRLEDLKELKADKLVAVTKDFATYHLEPGQLRVTVTLPPDKEGEKPVEKTLALAHHEKATIVGRTGTSDLVFEAPLSLFKDLAGEPLPKDLVDLFSSDVTRLEVASGDTKLAVLKVNDKWFRADAAGRPDTEVDASKVDDVIKAATGLKARRWAAYDAKDRAAFGLDKPAITITLAGEKKNAALLIAEKEVAKDVAALFDESPMRYGMAEGGERIAVLGGNELATLLGAAKKLGPEKPKAEPEKTDDGKGN